MSKGAIIGLSVGVVAVIVIIFVFTLSGGSSTRDMIVGEWDMLRTTLKFNDDGTVYELWDPEEQGTWALGGDDKILTIVSPDGEPESFQLKSVSDTELCLLIDEEMMCFNRHNRNAIPHNYDDEYYYEEEAVDDGDYYYEKEAVDDGDYYYSYGWSEYEMDEYMESCSDEANYRYCECTLDYIMDRYSSPDDLYNDGDFEVLMDAAEECLHLIY